MSGDWVGRLREAVRCGRVEWKMHALERMLEDTLLNPQRGLSSAEVLRGRFGFSCIVMHLPVHGPSRGRPWPRGSSEKSFFRASYGWGIGRREVLATLEAGEVIERYPERRPFPAVLLLGGLRWPLHVVAAYDAGEDRCHVVTAYRPSAERFHEDWKTRR